ncbi:MAG: histidine phosphatase family protein [Pseudomonadota bacterium]
MSLRLVLMRHAKSSWANATQDDHARPLNERGRLAAASIGRWLIDQHAQPALVLSSDAARTRETWLCLSPAVQNAPEIRWEPGLYLAAPTQLFDHLRRLDGQSPVLLLAHNPGIAALAHALVASPPAHPRFADYPTAATLIVDFAVERWADIRPGEGEAMAFIVPRDLE